MSQRKPVLRISPSVLEEYRLTTIGAWGKTDSTLIEYLTTPFRRTPAMDFGSAFHKVVEKGDIGTMTKSGYIVSDEKDQYTVEMSPKAYRTALDMHNEYKGQSLHEQWRGGVLMENDSYIVGTLLKVDVIWLNTIDDIKTSKMAKTWMEYWEAVQWQMYLRITGMNLFRYRHIRVKDSDVAAPEEIFVFRQTDMPEGVIDSLVNGFINWLELNGLIGKMILPEEKYFTIGL